MPVPLPDRPPKRPYVSFGKRLGWFLLLYASGVGVTALVAYGLKLVLHP